MALFEIIWPIFFPLLGVVIALLHIRVRKFAGPEVIGTILMWQLAVGFGLAYVWAGFGHLFLSDRVAESIGWATGSPFQLEVGMWDVAMGTCGLLCLKFRDDFWTAVIIGPGIFSLLAGLGHVRDLVLNGNAASNNAGPVMYIDVFYPLILAGMLIWYRKHRSVRGASPVSVA